MEQAVRLKRLIIGSELEFRGLSKEIDTVNGHDEKTSYPGNTHSRCQIRGFRREPERPYHQKRAEQRADGDKDNMESAERHDLLIVEKPVEDRAIFCEKKQGEHYTKK